MWTVVYLAKNKKIAEKISRLMTNEGVLVKLQPVNKNSRWSEGQRLSIFRRSAITEHARV